MNAGSPPFGSRSADGRPRVTCPRRRPRSPKLPSAAPTDTHRRVRAGSRHRTGEESDNRVKPDLDPPRVVHRSERLRRRPWGRTQRRRPTCRRCATGAPERGLTWSTGRAQSGVGGSRSAGWDSGTAPPASCTCGTAVTSKQGDGGVSRHHPGRFGAHSLAGSSEIRAEWGDTDTSDCSCDVGQHGHHAELGVIGVVAVDGPLTRVVRLEVHDDGLHREHVDRVLTDSGTARA